MILMRMKECCNKKKIYVGGVNFGYRQNAPCEFFSKLKNSGKDLF